MRRTIFHIDLDAFFVAVERTFDPALIGRPVVVGGTIGSRGVVTSASYEARAYGVRSAMPIAIARRLCPDAVFLPNRHGVYGQVSKKFMAVLRDFSPVVQPVSVDEAYVDMTGTEALWGMPVEAARRIRERVEGELRVTASIGIAESKLVAKIASGEAKPDGLLEVKPGESAAFLAPLPMRRLPGLGPKAEEAIKELGIRTLAELAEHPAGPLQRAVGANAAQSLQRRAAGIDHTDFETTTGARSISAETTFGEDTDDVDYLGGQLRKLTERVGTRLRKSGLHARTVTLKLRYHDFETITRQATLPRPGDGNDAIYVTAKELLAAAMARRLRKVRLIGVGVGNLAEPSGQLSMLDDDHTDDSSLSGTVDDIRARFGEDAIGRGRAGSRAKP